MQNTRQLGNPKGVTGRASSGYEPLAARRSQRRLRGRPCVLDQTRVVSKPSAREAAISRLMLQRREDIENATTAGPVTSSGRAALASSVVAHAVVELEIQLVELKKKLEPL